MRIIALFEQNVCEPAHTTFCEVSDEALETAARIRNGASYRGRPALLAPRDGTSRWWYEGKHADLAQGPNRFRVYLSYMPDFELREVLACPRVDEVPNPSTPSFNCECEQCGARVWVAYSSPIEPIRMCVACSAAHEDQIRQAKRH